MLVKHKIVQGVIVGVSLALIAAAATDVFNLDYHGSPLIKEIKVTFREPTPIVDMIIDDRCENKLGYLDVFLECMLQLKEQYGE